MADAVLFRDERGNPYVQLGDNILRFEEEEIDEHYVKKAENELRETPHIVDQAIEDIKDLIKAEEGLVVPADDKAFLLKYLRPHKFYSTSAFRVMRKFYKFKLKYPKYSSSLLPVTVEKAYLDEIVYFFPKRTSAGARVMSINVGNRWNPKEVSLTILIKALLVALEIAMAEPRTQVGGVHILLDLNGLSLSHITQFTPSLAKMILWIVQDCVAIRLKGVYIINQLPIFKLVYRIFKPFLAEKLKNRLHFIGTDWNTLKMHIDEECLPARLGGTLNSVDCPGHCLYQVIEHYTYRYEGIHKLFIRNMYNVEYVYEKTFIFNSLMLSKC
ncbi:CRAL-TRIO domain containing protein [Oryctes borbonicus]|uniref:CRAL-TRIO domain containing protein n=1 Tax=Oryctes borbonicus TaxID=1629725 RepID=A0A0T6B2B1_9SCAR|nr:CRAL-TRIO domain containing protein [Oryctes borbonicus]